MSLVIINADDFGLNKHCSEAIALAFSKGLITDTTMMATGEYFDEAAELARKQGFFDKIGIHLNLTEGVPLTDDIKKQERFVTDGRFNKGYNRNTPLKKAEKDAVYKELSAQFKKLEDAGIKITHADSHHHIHTGIFLAPVVFKVCAEHGIDKIRIHRNLGTISAPKRIIKNSYNKKLLKNGFKTTAYFAYVVDIQNEDIPDNTEIMVHPDFDRDGVLIDRRKTVDGFPTGYELPDYTKLDNITMRGYPQL